MRRLVSLLALASASLPAIATAQPALSAALPAAHGQQALALRAEGQTLRAHVCATSPCSPDGGTAIPLPDDVRLLLSSTSSAARSTEIELADGKRVLRIDIPRDKANPAAGTFVLLVAAPLTGKPSEPLILHSGWTGISKGEHGEERASVVLDEPSPSGKGRRVLVGEHREDVSICGRPALVGAKEISPATLELTRAPAVQNLSQADRAAAKKIIAERASGERPARIANLLRATAASSAAEKKFATITDGDPETTWSEGKIGDGAGEFVTFSSSTDVGIQAIEITVRPKQDIEGAAAPKSFYLATADKILEVTMPEDAWKQPPGTRYTVKLPEELRTACVALVLNEAYAGKPRENERDPRVPHVTIAEVAAVTAFDGQTVEGMVGALAGGGDRARAAAAMLARSGPPGIQATIAGYDKLDDAGKQLAGGVIDGATCNEQVPFFAAQLSKSAEVGRPRPAPGELDPELIHARDRLRRCGRLAAPALAALVAAGPQAKPGSKPSRAWLVAADELALIAPAEAVPVILDALAKADDSARRDLRASLARAAKSDRSWPAFKDELAADRFNARPEVARVDLLRAVGPSLLRVDGASRALGSIATPSASFRTRYLLQAPSAELARAGDAQAQAFLRASLRSDPDAHVRVRAAEVAGKVPAVAGDLVAAIEDGEVRVREAAINALAEVQAAGVPAPKGLAEALEQRLASDEWTFVRAGAARTLGALPAEAGVDRALAAALKDTSPDVRGRALDALGEHRAGAYADLARDLQEKGEETPEVRAHAVLALAAMCDKSSLGYWTKVAQRAKSPLDEADRRIGSAAIAALGALHPADLAARLNPLLSKDTPPPVREMARAALAGRGQCQ